MNETEFRFFDYWEGRLDEWLELIRTNDPDGPGATDWHQASFPTQDLLTEYVTHIRDRPEDEIMALLRHFLFPPTTFDADRAFLEFRLNLASATLL